MQTHIDAQYDIHMQTHDCASTYIDYDFASKDLGMGFISVANSQAVVDAYYIGEDCFSKSASGVVLVTKRISSLAKLPVFISTYFFFFVVWFVGRGI